ncbi:MAG: adenylate/guanylate cyclase domain-containing protein [Dehalococcoidia bacterium]
MTERILFVPTWRISPIACRSMPGIRTALDELRRNYTVDVHTWPCIRGGPEAPASWAGAAECLADSITPETHLVVFGAATPISLMALASGAAKPLSFTALGMAVPNATLHAIGAPELVNSPEQTIRFSPTETWAGGLLKGVDAASLKTLVSRIDAEIDWSYLAEFQRSFETLNLLHERPFIEVPTLFLNTPLDVESRETITKLFLKFVPDAELGALELWPADLGSREAGLELSGRVSRFLDSLSRRRIFAAILFTDIVDSTVLAAEMGDGRWAEVVRAHAGLVRRQLKRNNGALVNTSGDGVFAVFDNPANALRCARLLVRQVHDLGCSIRAGVHMGEYDVIDDEVGGLAINIAARVAAKATADEILVSDTIKQLLVGSDFVFEDRGVHTLKGIPEEWRVHILAN